MDLEDQARARESLRQRRIQPNHRDLDEVRRGPLHDGVDSDPLSEGALGGIPRLDLRNRSPAAENRRGVPGLPRGLDCAVEEGIDSAETRAIVLDDLLRPRNRVARAEATRRCILQV